VAEENVEERDMAKLQIAVAPGNGISNFWVAIDHHDVVMHGTQGEIDVDDQPEHGGVMWYTGMPGADIGIQIAQGAAVLVKASASISNGTTHGYISGPFKLAHPGE